MSNKNKFDISVKTIQHFEDLLADELFKLGAGDIKKGKRIVYCTGDMELLYKANYCLRTAMRVLIPVVEFEINTADEIYEKALRTDWTQYLDVDRTFAIDPNVRSVLYKHEHYASLKLKDAVADVFKKKQGRRPDVNPENPDVLFHLHINENNVSISLDSSGTSLNRRGYRLSGGFSPLNEVLAAGMVMLTGWDGQNDFYDPMCGSATIALEAHMIAANIPAGYLREEFAFMKWNNFDKGLWNNVKSGCDEQIRDYPGSIYAADNDPNQLKIAANNIQAAEFEDDINLGLLDFFDLMPQSESGVLVINPPYGERIDQHDITELYRSIGDHLKKNWPGHACWIISSNMDAIKRIGLKPSKKFNVLNGTLQCQFMRFDLFSGSHSEFVRSKKQAK